jgi:TolA-binding protein
MEDLSYLRGDVAAVKDELGRRGTLSEDMDFRLSGLEGQLVHVEDALVLGLDGYNLAPVVMPAPVVSPKNPSPTSSSESSLPGGAGAGGPTDGPGEPAGAKPEAGSVAGPAESSGPTPVEAPAAESKVAASVDGTPRAGGGGSDVAAEEVQVEPLPPGPAEVLFGEGKALYAQGKWRDAGRRFLKIRKKHSSSEHVLESQFLLSMCLFELQRYKDALSEFQKVIDARGSVELSAQSMYMQGMSFLKLGTAEDREAAEIFFADVTGNWPKSSWAKKAKKELGALRGN